MVDWVVFGHTFGVTCIGAIAEDVFGVGRWDSNGWEWCDDVALLALAQLGRNRRGCADVYSLVAQVLVAEPLGFGFFADNP